MRNSPLRAFASPLKQDNKKKSLEKLLKMTKDDRIGEQQKRRTKNVDEQIERGDAPNPNESKKRLNQYLDYIHDRKIV